MSRGLGSGMCIYKGAGIPQVEYKVVRIKVLSCVF